jgi:hypothetical protein
MTIRRRFEPDPEALEQVVDILYRLLVEAPGGPATSGASMLPEAQDAPCLPTEPE